jgi:hypothetical protein
MQATRNLTRCRSVAKLSDRRLTFPNDFTGVGLFQLAIAHSADFTADLFFAQGNSSLLSSLPLSRVSFEPDQGEK